MSDYTIAITESGDGAVVDVDIVPPPGASVAISEIRVPSAHVIISENDGFPW